MIRREGKFDRTSRTWPLSWSWSAQLDGFIRFLPLLPSSSFSADFSHFRRVVDLVE
jgi:hypothetical protein